VPNVVAPIQDKQTINKSEKKKRLDTRHLREEININFLRTSYNHFMGATWPNCKSDDYIVSPLFDLMQPILKFCVS